MDKNLDKLLTQEDLAKRWQVTVSTITNWRNAGILQPVKGLPVIRFHPSYIAELEGVKMEKTSPLYARKLERRIEELEQENQRLKGIIAKVLAEVSEAVAYRGEQYE